MSFRFGLKLITLGQAILRLRRKFQRGRLPLSLKLPSPKKYLSRSTMRFGLLFSIIFFLVCGGHSTPALALDSTLVASFNPQVWFQTALNWIEGLGWIAPLAYIGLYILSTVAFGPGSVMTLSGGAIFGLVQGTVYVTIGAVLGATAAFLIGRYLARDWISKKTEKNPKFKAVDEAIAKEGRKIVVLLRLSPVFPFNLLNYALGLTKVSFGDYFFGFLGMLPGTILYVYLGFAFGSAASGREKTPAEWAFLVVGLIATFAVVWIVTKIARKALAKEIV